MEGDFPPRVGVNLPYFLIQGEEMKTFRFSQISLVLLTAAFVCVSAVQGAAPIPTSPEQDAVVDLRPAATRDYKTPEARNWDLEYNPAKLKKDAHGEDSHPTPVVFQWKPCDAPDASYVVELSTNSDFTGDDLVIVDAGKATECQATNVAPGATLFWRVKAIVKDGDAETTCYSDVASFKTAATLPRWYDLPGISNVRDAGGWKAANGKRIKKGMVFRGSEFDNHMKIEESSREFIVKKLGVRVDLDLRGKSEWGGSPDYASPLGSEVRWINFPISSYSGILDDRNKKMFRDIFALLAKPETYPVYTHCWAGEDRCGTLNMGIKAVLGVSDNDIFTDYELTTFSIFGERRIGSGEMIKFREALKKYGENEPFSVQFVNYLKECGVTDEELDSIRNLLLEDAQ